MTEPEYMRWGERREEGKWRTAGKVVLGMVVGGLVVVIVWWVTGWWGEGVEGDAEAGWDAARQRALGAKLLTEGLKEQAIRAFERYLEMGGVGSSEVANVSYLLGKTCMELGRYEEALVHFYRANLAEAGGKVAAEARRAEVVCLERMGRLVDARYALDRETALRGGGTQEVRGVVVAKIGEENVTVGDVHDYLQRLPRERQREMDTARGREDILRQLVAERLLYKKGQMAGIDRLPEVRREVEGVMRGIVVRRVMEEEVKKRVKVGEDEVRRYYERNRDRFKRSVSDGTNEVAEVPAFEVVRGDVERAYVAEAEARAMEEVLGELMRAYRVELYPERLEGGR